LLLLVASVYGQYCYTQPVNNCTFATSGLNCSTYPGTCYRSFSAGACNTSSSSSCPGTACANAAFFTDGASCSKCADTCSQFQTNATCVNSGSCSWIAPGCTNTLASYSPPCASTTQVGCVAEQGCFWLDFSDNQCGAPTARSFCSQCNGTLNAYRSALYNNVGKTCTWSMDAPFTTAFSFTVNAASQASTLCSAFTAPDPVADPAAITAAAYRRLFGNLLPFANISTVNCAAPTNPPTLAPQTSAPSPAPTTLAPQPTNAVTTAPSSTPSAAGSSKAPSVAGSPTMQVASARSLIPGLAVGAVFFAA